MKHPYFYVIFFAIGFQIYLLSSLFWMLYWRKRVQASGITGWRAMPLALAPMALLLLFCIVGLARTIISAFY